MGFPGGSEVKVSASNVGDLSLIPGSGRSPGEGNGNPLQYLAWRIPWMEEPYGCTMGKSGIMPFAATWIGPTIIILSEVS